ncbi:MAG TPA: hypothetical protein VF283_12830 [Bryobacteraceae bacterium]
MRLRYWIHRVLLASALTFPVILTGCVHAGYYDAAHHDHHRWNSNERRHYNQWENENHRHHTDFKKLPPKEQQQYWDWRHNQH